VRGEISELTTLIYEARENALAKIAKDAASCGADDVAGIKTYVYHLGGGIIELMAIGTAIKKMPQVQTQSSTLLVQAVIKDKDTFVNLSSATTAMSLNEPTRDVRNPIFVVMLFVLYLIVMMLSHQLLW
jgi:hypothetical protein